MAKKSRKRPKKANAGCMWGLISMFDFRQGHYTQRLLSDKKLGSRGSVHSENKFDVLSNLEEKHDDVSDTDTEDLARVDSGKASIKALIAEEMSKASKKIPSSRVEQLSTEMGFGANNEKYHMKANKSYKLESDSSRIPSSHVNLAKLMVEFCKSDGDTKKNYISEIEKHCILQKALSDITKALLAQKSDDSTQIVDHGEIQPKEFMDAIETLNSNKDLFLKLLEDPNSPLFKHIIELQNAQSPEILNRSKQIRHNFFRRKDKSDEAKSSNESCSQALKRIVVLKPTPASFEDHSNTITPISPPKLLHNLQHQRVPSSSHFSIKEIKRRLKNVIGESKKEQNLIAMDGVLHKIPYGSQNSDVKSSKLPKFLKRGDKDANLKMNEPTQYRESIFYEEAKKRLAEMLNLDSQNEVSSPRQVSKSLGRILSLPGYHSSIQSTNGSPINSDSKTPEAQLCIGEDASSKGSTKTEEIDSVDIILVESNTDEVNERCSEEVFPMVPVLELSEETTLSVSVSLDFKPVQRLEALEITVEELDRPSPVSVLEPVFSEHTNSPERTRTDPAELILEPRHINFEESVDPQLILTSTVSEANETELKYVKTVLKASGLLNTNRLPEKWQSSSDQLLDPFVFDEVEILCEQLLCNPKLLFDCINEVLVDIQERYLGCTPWISFIKPNIRPISNGNILAHEVCKRVDRNLCKVNPYTLDRVLEKDLDDRVWMNVRAENDGAVIDIGEVILEYIMEETILELWE